MRMADRRLAGAGNVWLTRLLLGSPGPPGAGKHQWAPEKGLLSWKPMSFLSVHVCHVLGMFLPGAGGPGGHVPGGRGSDARGAAWVPLTHRVQETSPGETGLASVERHFLMQILGRSQLAFLPAACEVVRALIVPVSPGEPRLRQVCAPTGPVQAALTAQPQRRPRTSPCARVSVQNPLWLQQKVAVQGLGQG